MGVEVTDAITPSPSPAGTAVRKLRNSPARAAAQAYSATMICTTTNGQKVGLRSVLTADVTTPVDPHTRTGERSGEDRSRRIEEQRQRDGIDRGRQREAYRRGNGDECEETDRHPAASVRVAPKIDIAACRQPARSCARYAPRTCTRPRERSCCSSPATGCAAWARRTRRSTPTCCRTVGARWCSRRLREERRSTPGFRSARVCAARRWRPARIRTCPT